MFWFICPHDLNERNKYFLPISIHKILSLITFTGVFETKDNSFFFFFPFGTSTRFRWWKQIFIKSIHNVFMFLCLHNFERLSICCFKRIINCKHRYKNSKQVANYHHVTDFKNTGPRYTRTICANEETCRSLVFTYFIYVHQSVNVDHNISIMMGTI